MRTPCPASVNRRVVKSESSARSSDRPSASFQAHGRVQARGVGAQYGRAGLPAGDLIVSAYDSVERWISVNTQTVTGAPREVYFADPSESDDNEPVADIAFPIK